MRKTLFVAWLVWVALTASSLSGQSKPPSTSTVAQPQKTQAAVQTPQNPPRENPPPKDAVPQPSPRKPEPEPANPIVEHLHAGMILDYATYLVAFVTLLSAVFLGAVGMFEWRQVEALKKEVAAERIDLRTDRRELHEERTSIQQLLEAAKTELLAQEQRFRAEVAEERKASEARIDQIEALKPELEAQERHLRAYQRFLAAVLSHHSRLLVGIIKGFGSALKPDEVTRLHSLISEAESALDLFHPDKSVRGRALLRLEHIGSAGSVDSLAQLRDDPAEETDIRLRAQDVLLKVKARLRSEHAP